MFSRRDFFFRGAALGAGSLYLSTFLKQLEAANDTARPLRVVFFVQGNGLYPDQIQPQGIERPRQPRQLEDQRLTGHRFPMSIDPLQPFADKITFVHGLSNRVARGSHGSGFAALGCFPDSRGAYRETIDAAIAKRARGLFPHVGLGVQNRPASIVYNMTAWQKGQAMPTQCNPLLAYQQYFAVAGEGQGRARFDARTQLLDFMREDVNRVQTRLNSNERERLGRYVEAFESMSNRQRELVRRADRIRRAAPHLDQSVGTVDQQAGQPTGIFDRLEAQLDIAAGVLIAGLTNVVTVSSGAGHGATGVSVDGTEVGLNAGLIGSHSIGHGRSYQNHNSTDLHSRIRRAHMVELAKFVRKLQGIPEGNRTMMDNTLIVYLSDSGESHHPVAHEWPHILIGDLGGRLRTGNRYLRYPWYGQTGHRTVANLYTTLLHAVGDRRERFGLTDVELRDINQNGPLEELLV
ncbi:MAG: DUF1552 domain-containing protein [Gemmataceae bacterium]